jgi:hypothetical protein
MWHVHVILDSRVNVKERVLTYQFATKPFAKGDKNLMKNQHI